MKVSALKPAVIAALLLVMIAISAAFGARAAGIKWWPGGRDRNSMLAGNPLPAAPPIPIAGGHPKLLAPLADIRPPENYAPPSSGFVTPPARQASAAAAAGAPAAAPFDGQPITGTIHSPAGTPARGAQVILVISTNDPRGHGGGRAVDSFVIARPDGRFALQPRRPPLGLFVRATEGYVWIPADSIKPDQTITLSRWARLELTVNEGAKPLPRARVTVSPAGDDLQVLVGNNVMMKADDEGRVTLDQVLPGETRLTWAKDEPSKPRPGAGAAWAEGENPRLPPRETRVKVEPGMTHKVTLGGTGRAVTGTIDPADVSEFAYRRGVIRPASPPTKSPVPTPATDSAAAGGTIFFDAHPDGTFTVTDVPPGQYELTIDLGIIVGKNIKIVERYAVARTTFTVPAIAGGANDQPLDIGKVPAAELKVLEIGQPFPKLAGKTPNGEPIAIQDFLERILLVQLGNPSAVRSRGESDWLHALRAHFGHNPMFAMLTLTTSQETRTDPAIGGDGPSPWPVMRLDALPEELESSAARLFLIDADGTLAAKNVTAAQVYAVLDKALDPRPDPRVTFDYVPRGPAKANPPFTNIPAPSATDAAAGATVTVIGGVPSWDTPKSNASVLTDGKLPPNEDAPGEAIFFQAGSLEGRFRIDLKDPTDVAEIRTYSWHKDTRAAQVFRVYASDGTGKDFDPAPTIGVDPTTHGWTNIAFVDTRPGMKPVGIQGVAKGGRYVSSISDKQKGTLGTYRHLLFQVFPTEADDVFGHTFYGEIDVIPREK